MSKSLFLARLVRAAPVLGALAAAALSAGCASPDPRWYTLGSAGAAGAGAAPTVLIGPVTVPARVDRPQLVLDTGAHEVRVDELSRWAAPLADEIAAALAATVSRRLDTAQVWVRTPAAPTVADVQVAVEIQRFELAPGDSVRVDAVWTLRRGKGSQSGRSSQREVPAAPGVDAAVAAQARALARVGDDLARAIAAGPP